MLDVAAVFVLAVALRLGPLYWSRLPFNPDGVVYAGDAHRTIASGTLSLSGLPTDSIGYTGLIVAASELLGVEPLYVAQPVSAIVGATTVVVAMAITWRIASAREWSSAACRHATIVAGLLLAVEGIYLQRSMPTDEQTLGLLLVPVFAIAAHRAIGTRHHRWTAVAVGIFLALPPLHNLDAVVAALTLSVLLTLAVLRTPTGRRAIVAVALGLSAWSWAVGYHVLAATVTPMVIIQTGSLSAGPGLYLAWIVVVLLGTGWFVTTSDRGKRWVLTGTVLAWFGIFALNAVVPIYPATSTTPTVLLVLLSPLAIPVVFAGIAIPAATRSVGSAPAGPVVGLIAATLVLVGFSLTAGLTPDDLGLLWRSHLFVHLPLMALAGIGLAWVDRRVDGRTLRVALTVVVLCSALVGTPVAYMGLDVLTYKGVTTSAEYEATAFAATEFDRWTTDDHLVRVARYHEGDASRLPAIEWIQGGPPPACPTLGQRSWTTTGAQLFPRSPIIVDQTRYYQLQANNSVVYRSTTNDPLTVIVPRDSSGGRCSAPLNASIEGRSDGN